MEFVKPYDKAVRSVCPSGEKIVDTYSLVIDKKTGIEELKATGKTNIYDYIQKSLPETLIYNIIERYNSGDINALNKIQGFYGDVTTMPKNLAEAQQILIDAQKTFMELPLETRAKYNHSVNQFLSAVEKEAQEYALKKAQEAILAEQEAQINNLSGAAPVQEGGNE